MYLEALGSIIPRVFAIDVHYAQWLSVNVRELNVTGK